MFTQLILDGTAPAVPLLEEFFDNLNADFRHMYPQDPIRVRRLLMQSLDEMLRQHNRSLIDFGFEAIELRGVRLQDEDDFWRPRIDIIRNEVQQQTQQLNGQQREFFDECSLRIAISLENNVSLICFLQGKGKEKRILHVLVCLRHIAGTGKSFLLKLLASSQRLLGRHVVIVGSSGLAASAFIRGTTAHYQQGFTKLKTLLS